MSRPILVQMNYRLLSSAIGSPAFDASNIIYQSPLQHRSITAATSLFHWLPLTNLLNHPKPTSLPVFSRNNLSYRMQMRHLTLPKASAFSHHFLHMQTNVLPLYPTSGRDLLQNTKSPLLRLNASQISYG